MNEALQRSKFWQKVNKSDGCWEWQGNAIKGYGVVKRNGKALRAHRESYRLTNGSVPDNLWVLHRCDNPLCVRPDHLFLGTPKQNVDDMVAKNRQAKGVQQQCAKLTDDDVREARRLHELGVTKRALARQFGVTQRTMVEAIRRITWRHVV